MERALTQILALLSIIEFVLEWRSFVDAVALQVGIFHLLDRFRYDTVKSIDLLPYRIIATLKVLKTAPRARFMLQKRILRLLSVSIGAFSAGTGAPLRRREVSISPVRSGRLLRNRLGWK